MTIREKENSLSVIMEYSSYNDGRKLGIPDVKKQNKRLSEILDYHGFHYKDCCLLICDSV